MIKITVNPAVFHALKQAFPKPANSADRALRKYVKVLEDMLFESLQRQATPLQRKLELFSIPLQKLANQGGQIGPNKLRLHAWLRQNGFSLVEPVVKGSNITRVISECKLTHWATLVNTLTIEDDILIHSTCNQHIDQHLDGDPASNLELMHLLYPEFKNHRQNPAALDEFDLVEVDTESLKSYIYWLNVEARHISREQKDQALRQARIILAIASVLQGHFSQRKKPSEFGRTYYEGTSIQNVNKELRRAILGNCWEYDIRSSVIAWKMGWAKEYVQTHAPGQDVRKVFQATTLYLEDKNDFMATVKHYTFGLDSPVPKDLQTKLLKTAFTAISFGARTTSTGWKNEVGEWSNPAIVNILRNSEDRQRFLADATVKAFIEEQGLLDDYLFARVKQQRQDLLQLPLLQTKSGRPSKAKILAYLYQHGETDIMNVVREVAAKHGHYGLRRMLIDQSGEPKGELKRGEHKSHQTDRVVLVLGPTEEVQTVQKMYQWLIEDDLSLSHIAKRLNASHIRTDLDREWTSSTVRQVLTNEKYIGNNVYNRRSFKLKKKHVNNPPDMWIRKEGAYEGVVSLDSEHRQHGGGGATTGPGHRSRPRVGRHWELTGGPVNRKGPSSILESRKIFVQP